MARHKSCPYKAHHWSYYTKHWHAGIHYLQKLDLLYLTTAGAVYPVLYCTVLYCTVLYCRGGISVVTEAGQVTQSHLVIRGARQGDEGNYTCKPSIFKSASLRLFVIDGESAVGSILVPQIDPSVPRPVVQSRRRPLLGPSPG